MIRIGIVGCGRILAAHLRGYRLLREAGVDDFRITALCSRKEADARMYVERSSSPAQRPAVSQIPGDPLAIGDEYLSDFQDDVETQVYNDYRQMIAAGPIDAVNDFSTHALHHQVAAEAFRHGKHLLTQKPLALSVAAARRMCAEAEARDVTFGVFENFRQSPGTRHLRWGFDTETLGRLQMVLLQAIGVWWAPNLVVAETPWRHVKREAGGISLDLGVHFFDQIRHMAGEIVSVEARTAVLEPMRHIRSADGGVARSIECDADDTFFASFDTAGGVVGAMAASWAGHCDATKPFEGVEYYGSRARVAGGVAVFDGGRKESLERLYEAGVEPQRREREFPLGLTDSFALNQLDWLRAIAERRLPETSGVEGLRDLAAAYAILESATIGARVAVADVLEGRTCEYQRPLNAAFGIPQ